MKRDMELVRKILFAVEDQGATPIDWIDEFLIEGYADEAVGYHVWMLAQAGFLEAINLSTLGGFSYAPRCLTWQGAELLDAIRDPEVWRRTKSGAATVGGAGVEFLWELAKVYAKQVIKERLGVDLT